MPWDDQLSAECLATKPRGGAGTEYRRERQSCRSEFRCDFLFSSNHVRYVEGELQHKTRGEVIHEIKT